ncbi:PREDICTED: putative uncharacterized protein FLJ26174 [Condylura cristata]|uniref:putative uncharacterized protein FLJ26174 n=1 Tax=Condylura cristata TaxID=143302 RepID=UPI000643CC1F|nr:PREDICTED: putative uncharacterized protein FLJ26174 [Condylura cristata]
MIQPSTYSPLPESPLPSPPPAWVGSGGPPTCQHPAFLHPSASSWNGCGEHIGVQGGPLEVRPSVESLDALGKALVTGGRAGGSGGQGGACSLWYFPIPAAL